MENPKSMDGRTDKRKTKEILNWDWSQKLLWIEITRRAFQEMCWWMALNEKQVGQVQTETERSTLICRTERKYLMIMENKVKRPICLGLTAS